MRWIKCTERLPNGPRPEYENDKGVVFRKGASIMLIYRSVTNNILALLKNEPEGWEWLSEEGEDIPVEAALKDFVVIQDAAGAVEIWSTAQYNQYVKNAVDVGACPAVGLITTFNESDRYLKSIPKNQSVEVEAAAKEYAEKIYPDKADNGLNLIKSAIVYAAFVEGYNFRANHLGEDREGQDEWKQRFVNWFFAHKTYFPTPDKCADWFEKNVSVKDFVGDQDKLWRAVLDKVISDQILEHEEVPTDTINYLSNRYHLIKKNP